MLVLAVPENLHKLLQDRVLAAVASLCEFGGVMVVAVHVALVLVIAVLSPEDCRTDRAREVLNVVLAIKCGYVGSS